MEDDDFKDITEFSAKAMKKLWDNEQDEVWNNELNNQTNQPR